MKFPKKWERIFKKFDNWSKLTKKLKEEKDFYPLEEYIFEPFKLTSPKKVQMVWIGQDPYSNDFHGEIVSHGLLFSTLIKDYIPPSLSNLLKELKRTHNINKKDGNLTKWAKKGILMMNASMTVRPGKPNSHQSIWKDFTSFILDYIDSHSTNLLFVGFGKPAEYTIGRRKNKTMFFPHPSPLNVSKPFIGTNAFKEIDKWFLSIDEKEFIKSLQDL